MTRKCRSLETSSVLGSCFSVTRWLLCCSGWLLSFSGWLPNGCLDIVLLRLKWVDRKLEIADLGWLLLLMFVI